MAEYYGRPEREPQAQAEPLVVERHPAAFGGNRFPADGLDLLGALGPFQQFVVFLPLRRGANKLANVKVVRL